jgi:hypothetical protein
LLCLTPDNAYTVELSDIMHLEQCLHDRLPNRHARCDRPLDYPGGDASRDRL